MAFDFKKEYKDLYLPKTKPELIDVPPMSFIAVAGTGNPNEENGSYAGAMGLLYAFSYTVKMSKMGAWQPDGYFDYTVVKDVFEMRVPGADTDARFGLEGRAAG